jgi:hypothetical protein
MGVTADTIRKVKTLAAQPLSTRREEKRVEIIMLKFKEDPEIIDKAITRIVHNTDWPFKLTIFDNRPLPDEENNRNTAKIWNKLIKDATCRYILIIDSDAYIPARKLEPCWLTRMMESIDKTGFVVPVSSSPGGAHQHVNGPLPYPATQVNKGIWSGYCFLFDREGEWSRMQPFDERFYIYGQDSEFAYRVGKRGGAIMRLDVYVEHIGGASFKQDDIREDDKIYARKLFEFLTKEI